MRGSDPGGGRVSDVTALIHLLAEKLRSEGASVDADPGAYQLTIERQGERLVVLLPEREMTQLLADGDELARDLWPGTSALEAAARILRVHLQESLESSPLESLEGRWRYQPGLFEKQ